MSIQKSYFKNIKHLQKDNDSEVFISKLNNKKIVVKIIKDAFFKDGLEDEVWALSKLNHPHIINLLEYYIFGDTAVNIFEYYEEESLFDYIQENGPLSQNKLISLITQINDALIHTNNQSLTHNDLKPENILVKDDGNYFCLADWDLASFQNDNKWGLGKGTLSAIAPEMILGLKYQNSDIYGLGCTVFYAQTGKRVYNLKSSTPRYLKIKAHLEKDLLIDESQLSPIINSMLCKNPIKRATTDKIKKYMDNFDIDILKNEENCDTHIYNLLPELIGEKRINEYKN